VVLVVDANVLIDYAKADDSVLALVVQHVGPVYIPRDVFDEVEQLDEDACARLGLVVVDGTLEQLLEAGETAGGLSFADRMCLILARDHGWVCVTNDGRLRRACTEADVQVQWGLQLMLKVVETGGMAAEAAIEVAAAIGRENPWIKQSVVDGFVAKVRA